MALCQAWSSSRAQAQGHWCGSLGMSGSDWVVAPGTGHWSTLELCSTGASIGFSPIQKSRNLSLKPSSQASSHSPSVTFQYFPCPYHVAWPCCFNLSFQVLPLVPCFHPSHPAPPSFLGHCSALRSQSYHKIPAMGPLGTGHIPHSAFSESP